MISDDSCANVRVSVVMPVFNRAHLAPRAIRSVLTQTFGNLELLVIDDASSDALDEAVAEIDDSRVRYIRRHTNGGGSAARNTGIAAARGEFVAFLDSDDEWSPEKLERQVELFINSTDTRLGAASCGMTAIDSNGEVQHHRQTLSGDVYEQLLRLSGARGTGSCLITTRQAIEAGVRFDESLKAFQDRDFLLQIARRFSIASVPDALVTVYRNHGGEYITGNPRNRLQGHVQMMDKLAAELDARPGLPALYHRRAARYAHMCGEIQLVRHHLAAAVRAEPMNARQYLWLLAAIFGPAAYGAIQRLRSVAKHA